MFGGSRTSLATSARPLLLCGMCQSHPCSPPPEILHRLAVDVHHDEHASHGFTPTIVPASLPPMPCVRILSHACRSAISATVIIIFAMKFTPICGTITTTNKFFLHVGRTSHRPALFLRCLPMCAIPTSDSMYVSSCVVLLPHLEGRMHCGYGQTRQPYPGRQSGGGI